MDKVRGSTFLRVFMDGYSQRGGSQMPNAKWMKERIGETVLFSESGQGKATVNTECTCQALRRREN